MWFIEKKCQNEGDDNFNDEKINGDIFNVSYEPKPKIKKCHYDGMKGNTIWMLCDEEDELFFPLFKPLFKIYI